MRTLVTAVISLVFFLACSGCTFLGKKDATWEQQFYEVDQYTIEVLETCAVTLTELGEAGVTIPDNVRTGLRLTVTELREARAQLRIWVDECGETPRNCPREQQIELGIQNLKHLAQRVLALLAEARNG